MKTTLAVFFLAMILVFSAYGQMTTEMVQQISFMDKALANIQQVGDFYFIPFPTNGMFQQANYGEVYATNRTNSAQIILRILAEFEKNKNLSVVTFEVQRDQSAHGANSKVHGILLKAVPKPPAPTSTSSTKK